MTSPARRFLMPLWEGGGTLPPELGVARRLIARGHEVHVVADPTVEDDARAAGCGFTPWQRAPHRTSLDPSQDLLRDWEVGNPLAMLGRIRDVFVAGPAADYAADTLEVVDEVRPDAVVPDFMLFGTIIAAQAAGLPVAPLVPNVWPIPTPGAPAVGPGFPPARTALGRTRDAVMLRLASRVFGTALPTLNAARAHHGLARLGSFFEQVTDTDRVLVLTSAAFDFSAPFVPASATYVGPVLDDPVWAEPWASPWPADHEDPLVLVGFSSTFQDQGPLLRRVVEALSTLPVRAVVTLGQMLDEGEVPRAPNVHVVESARHRPILADASLVVTHGGHGTTLKALSTGVPLVCIPMGRDQNDTAARVVHHGAGVRLRPTATATRIRDAIREVLADPTFARRARALADAIAAEEEDTDVADELEHLLTTTTEGNDHHV